MNRFLFCACVSLSPFAPSLRADAPAASNLDALIEQLGDRLFAVRQSARKQLVAMEEDALPALRKGSSHPDLAVRDEVEAIRKQIARQSELRQLERALGMLKEGRVDCAVEALSRIRCSEYDEHVWQAVLDAGWGLANRIRKSYPEATKLGEVEDRLPAPVLLRVPGTNYAEFASKRKMYTRWREGSFAPGGNGVYGLLVQAQGIQSGAGIAESLILCNGPITTLIGSCNDSIVFVNGDINVSHAIGNSIVICDGAVKTSGIGRSIVIASGNLSGSPILGRSEIGMGDSAVITGGRKPEGKVTIGKGLVKFDEPAALKFVKWFVVSDVGFEVSSVARAVKIDKLVDGSLPARSGFKSGDRITSLDGTPVDSAESFRRALRRAVTRDRCVIAIDRDGKPSELLLNFRADEKAKMQEAKSRPQER